MLSLLAYGPETLSLLYLYNVCRTLPPAAGVRFSGDSVRLRWLFFFCFSRETSSLAFSRASLCFICYLAAPPLSTDIFNDYFESILLSGKKPGGNFFEALGPEILRMKLLRPLRAGIAKLVELISFEEKFYYVITTCCRLFSKLLNFN